MTNFIQLKQRQPLFRHGRYDPGMTADSLRPHHLIVTGSPKDIAV